LQGLDKADIWPKMRNKAKIEKRRAATTTVDLCGYCIVYDVPSVFSRTLLMLSWPWLHVKQNYF